MTLGPLAAYQAALKQPGFEPDPAQRAAALALQDCYQQLTLSRPGQRGGWLGRLRSRYSSPVQGLYLWGGVGRGKTWLMDLFFDSLPFEEKTRLHFHRFMQRLHDELKSRPATRDPLPAIAADWARTSRVLCFDEFFVSDIADAMILAGLLDELFSRGVMLVATSNIHPDDLYRDGLQRRKFLPAIELIKQHTKVLELSGVLDFRLRILEAAEIYHWPLDADADQQLMTSFERISPGQFTSGQPMLINGRTFETRYRGDGVVWFDFNELCAKPVGPPDYIEIARSFNTVLLSNLPALDELINDQARRFINLVDEFYDRNVKLIISAAVPIDDLYSGRRLAFEFSRTRSRLTEMQSHDYLATPHLA